MDLEKVEAVMSWERSKSVFEIRSFLGLAGYYRRFIEDFSRLATPMTLASGVSMDLEKVEAMMSWERLKSVFEICSFLGLARYYRRFIEDLS